MKRTQEEYVGAWRSVNDIQSQLGEKNFRMFLDDVNNIVSKFASIPVCYLTRKPWVGSKELICKKLASSAVFSNTQFIILGKTKPMLLEWSEKARNNLVCVTLIDE